jgi:hypothetical protein
MATNSMMTPSVIGTPDRARELNFTKAGAPKLNATNQPTPKKPRKKKK